MTNTDKVSNHRIEDGLAGKVAIVTGGSRGIGASQATVLANAGATVYIADVLPDEGSDTVDEITDDGGDAVFHQLDVSDEAQWKEFIAHIGEEHGRLDVLVNNAGIASEAPVAEEELEVWDQVLDVNLKGTWLGMKHAIPLMGETGGGSIVNISSVYGLRGAKMGESAAYQATKGGVTVLTKNAANAYAELGVRVNSIHPGYIETPMTDGADELADAFLSTTPLNRSGSTEEVAKAVYFLASDLSSYVDGENLVVDGGYLSN